MMFMGMSDDEDEGEGDVKKAKPARLEKLPFAIAS
jgi:hypothetical protein